MTISSFEISTAQHAKGFKIKFKVFGDSKYRGKKNIKYKKLNFFKIVIFLNRNSGNSQYFNYGFQLQ